jgi:hypothetical protein
MGRLQNPGGSRDQSMPVTFPLLALARKAPSPPQGGDFLISAYLYVLPNNPMKPCKSHKFGSTAQLAH